MYIYIGTGATATVIAAIYKPSRRGDERRTDLGRKPFGVAVKVFTPESITASILRVFAKEIDLMRKLKHRTYILTHTHILFSSLTDLLIIMNTQPMLLDVSDSQ
jgi:hypothetical protein